MSNDYGDIWESNPEANAFLALIDSTAARVAAGRMNEADGRLVLSNYAAQREGAAAAIQAAQQAQQQQALTAAGVSLLQNSAPCQVQHSAFVPCPVQPAATVAPVNCVSQAVGNRVQTSCQ